MIDDNSQNANSGQGGIDSETERRNRENETGDQWQQQPQAGQQQPPQSGQQSDSATGQSLDSQSVGSQPIGGQASGGQPGSEGGSGFVGSSGDQSSDYLTQGDSQNFAPEGQGATDTTSAGTADIETGQSSNPDATLDDGADPSE